ncbi:hypothetical protein NEUTE2DRAFT_49145, partial [Neurospora tetrasperma FGSC 2509]
FFTSHKSAECLLLSATVVQTKWLLRFRYQDLASCRVPPGPIFANSAIVS